mmetsp:Transcript_25122/g.60422  ORF Transcript_25122/g.60422 Transcript_25122/m.60422 type:complete len:208 (-) Transcript_25122:76-699(-)
MISFDAASTAPCSAPKVSPFSIPIPVSNIDAASWTALDIRSVLFLPISPRTLLSSATASSLRIRAAIRARSWRSSLDPVVRRPHARSSATSSPVSIPRTSLGPPPGPAKRRTGMPCSPDAETSWIRRGTPAISSASDQSCHLTLTETLAAPGPYPSPAIGSARSWRPPSQSPSLSASCAAPRRLVKRPVREDVQTSSPTECRPFSGT